MCGPSHPDRDGKSYESKCVMKRYQEEDKVFTILNRGVD